METHDLLKVAFIYETLCQPTVFEWYKHIKSSKESWEDDHRSGHPPTSLTDEKMNSVNTLVCSDRSIRVQQMA